MKHRRLLATIALTVAVVVGRSEVYRHDVEGGAAPRRVGFASSVAPLLWGADEDAAVAARDALAYRQTAGLLLRLCHEPWLSSYMDGDSRPIKRMLACAVKLWPVPGGIDKAISVVDCESKFDPFAVNESGRHIGLFQHDRRYWLARWRRWGLDLGVPQNPTNAWSSIIVSVRIINRYGWGAWSCA